MWGDVVGRLCLGMSTVSITCQEKQTDKPEPPQIAAYRGAPSLPISFTALHAAGRCPKVMGCPLSEGVSMQWACAATLGLPQVLPSCFGSGRPVSTGPAAQQPTPFPRTLQGVTGSVTGSEGPPWPLTGSGLREGTTPWGPSPMGQRTLLGDHRTAGARQGPCTPC